MKWPSSVLVHPGQMMMSLYCFAFLSSLFHIPFGCVARSIGFVYIPRFYLYLIFFPADTSSLSYFFIILLFFAYIILIWYRNAGLFRTSAFGIGYFWAEFLQFHSLIFILCHIQHV